jgi:hypothetical protein
LLQLPPKEFDLFEVDVVLKSESKAGIASKTADLLFARPRHKFLKPDWTFQPETENPVFQVSNLETYPLQLRVSEELTVQLGTGKQLPFRTFRQLPFGRNMFLNPLLVPFIKRLAPF